MSLVRQILERRANAWEEAKGMLDTAEAEGRSLSAEEQGKFDAINSEINALDEQRKSIEDAEARAKDAAEAMERLHVAPKPEVRADMDAADKLRALARGEIRAFDTNEGLPPVNFRDLTKGSATAGGNTIKTSFREQLLEHMIEVSGVLMAGPTVLNTASGENIEVPITTSHGTAALTTEGSAISESDPAFGKRTLGAYKYATLVQVSHELVEDTSVDLLGYLARQAGRGVGNSIGTDLVVGNGSSKPSGIVQTASTGVTGGAGVTGAFTADNLIDLYFLSNWLPTVMRDAGYTPGTAVIVGTVLQTGGVIGTLSLGWFIERYGFVRVLFACFACAAVSVGLIGSVAQNAAGRRVALGSLLFKAAGCLLVREAGGTVTDLRGEAFLLTSPHVVASNGLIHDQILSVLQGVDKTS